MNAAGSKLRRTTDGYVHWCPACREVHHYRTDPPQPNGAVWSFNGDLERPSFTPSMRIQWGRFADPAFHTEPGEPDPSGICHYVVTNGQIAYCSDCTHSMAGKTVDLPDWPYAPGTYGGIEE